SMLSSSSSLSLPPGGGGAGGPAAPPNTRRTLLSAVSGEEPDTNPVRGALAPISSVAICITRDAQSWWNYDRYFNARRDPYLDARSLRGRQLVPHRGRQRPPGSRLTVTQRPQLRMRLLWMCWLQLNRDSHSCMSHRGCTHTMSSRSCAYRTDVEWK